MKVMPLIPLRMQVAWLATCVGSTASRNTDPGKYAVHIANLHTCCGSKISGWIRMTTRQIALFKKESGMTTQVLLSPKSSSELAETHHD